MQELQHDFTSFIMDLSTSQFAHLSKNGHIITVQEGRIRSQILIECNPDLIPIFMRNVVEFGHLQNTIPVVCYS
jgi:hypothetical protein